MRHTPSKLVPLALVLIPIAAWAAWLGWDQHRDVHPDGSVTGPYETWQVIGLLLSLLPAVYWAASRGRTAQAALCTTAGLTGAAAYDWSDDSSGLFMVGVVMVMAASLAVTFALSALIRSMTRSGRRDGPRPPGPGA
ncbi:hypothetical protein ACTVZO_01795 [Streptomyces sp. IBSNAI002]|uniref:hypothetical protein n=1 Tax=Streptomyces sp. IBSNAI002 TaxID=3457500 RepID=UPI003FD387F2